MKNTLKKVWDIASTTLVVLVVLCAVFLMGSRLMGYQCLTVLSGSMEPEYSVGDLIYVKQVYNKNIAAVTDSEERKKVEQEKIAAVKALVEDGTLKVGDPITFVEDENLTVCTHRIVEIDEENHRIRTKGDANKGEDASPVLYQNVVGEVHFAIPLLGYVSSYIQNPPGMYVAIGAGVVLVLLVFLPDTFGKKKASESMDGEKTEAEVLE